MDKQTKKIIQSYDRELTKQEIKYARQLAKEINRAIIQAGNDLINSGVLTVETELEHTEQLSLIATRSNIETMSVFVGWQANLFDYNVPASVLEQATIKYSSEILRFSKLKSDTTFNQIRETIVQSMTSGSISSKDISKEILKIKKLTKPRALMIARTETHASASYAQHEVAKAYNETLPIENGLLKRWNAVLDKRVRNAHRAVNGKTIPFEQMFSVGGSLMNRPHDPAGGAHNVINCRCVLTYPLNMQ